MDIYDHKYDYVHTIANEIMPEFGMDENGNYIQVLSYAPNVFLRRKDNIEFPFTYQKFINNEDIMGTLEGYGIDSEKFWYAILFIYDITQQKCINVLTLGETAKVQAENLKSMLSGIDSFTVTSSNKKKLHINDSLVIASLHKCLEEILSNSENDLQGHIFKLSNLSEQLYSPSIQMWFAANRFIKLFETLKLPNLRAKDKTVVYKQGLVDRFAVSGGNKIVSYNKLLLVSRLMYLMRYTRNDVFLYTENSLKGILKQYKDYKLNTFSKVYSA